MAIASGRSPDQRAFFERATEASASEAPTLLLEAEAILRAAPGSAAMWHAKGVLLVTLEKLEAAIEAFGQAQSAAPRQPVVAHALAETLLAAGLPAVDAFAKALSLSPGAPDILLGLSDALLAEGRRPEAVEGLDSLLSRSPGWIEGHEALARVRWLDGEREGFARSFNQALQGEPNNLDLRRAHLISLLHAGQFDAVLTAVAEGRQAMGSQLLFDANEAVALGEQGRVQEAEPLFEALAGIDDPLLQVRYVRLLLRANKPEKVAAVAERFADHVLAHHFVPYQSIAWRQLGDPRWAWLESDPRLVGVFDLTDQLPPLNELADHLRSLHRLGGQHLEQSVRGGTQTDGNLLGHVHPLIQQTAAAIRTAVQRHVVQLPPVDTSHPLLGAPRDRPVAFSGSWSVRLTSGGHHSNHVHPMGWLSSALYITLPEQTPQQRADRHGWLKLGEPQAELGLGLEPFRHVEPQAGRLVLFPSTMWHGTVPFAGEGAERLTVAFDVAPPQ